MPKQFAPIAGQPMLWHALLPFAESPRICRIVLVVPEADIGICREWFGTEFPKVDRIVGGGEERHQSVVAGLEATAAEEEYLLIHDGARPLVSGELIERVVAETITHGAASAAIPVKDTIKVVENGRIRSTPDRTSLWHAQTPQGFRRGLLLEAIAATNLRLPTDESMWIEHLGTPVHIVEGEDTNIKVTTQSDMEWASWALQRRRGKSLQRNSLRIGNGYDVHRFEPGRDLILGGVKIPWKLGLAGHSDADVLTHAVIDGLLGAAALGDIGRMFPDTDPEFEGISSLTLLERVHARLEELGVQVLNIDAVIMAEEPKLSAHIEKMEEALAAILGIGCNLVSVKATTSEGLGFVGRGEGIAAC